MVIERQTNKYRNKEPWQNDNLDKYVDNQN